MFKVIVIGGFIAAVYVLTVYLRKWALETINCFDIEDDIE